MGFETLEQRELLSGTGSGLRVVLDPGHGGGNIGTAGAESRVAEKDLTLDMANRVKNYLSNLGVAAQLTRTSDVDVDYRVRAETAKGFDADFFLSLHFNGFARGSGERGTEALVMASNTNLPEDRVFADTLIQWTCNSFQQPNNRGVKVTDSATGVMTDAWFANTSSDHPVVSALLEVESISSNLDVDRFFNNADPAVRASNRDRVAQNIAQGIVQAGRNLPTPAAPEPLQLQVVSNSRVDLSWKNVGEERSYRVFIWRDGREVLLGTVGRNVTSYSATGLTPGQIYWFRVEASNGTNSATNSWKQITMPMPAVVAPDPLRLSVTSSSTVGLSWTNVVNEDGYRVFIWQGGQQVQLGTAGRDVTSYITTGLTPGQAYWFRVEAFNSTNSATTSWGYISIPALAVVAPDPLRLSVTSSSSVGLSWMNVANEDGYRVFIWQGGQQVQLGTAGRDATSYTAMSLTPGQVYWFRVEAFNATNSATTPWVQISIPVPVVVAPDPLRWNAASRTQIDLSWTNVTNEDGYRIYTWNGLQAVLLATVGREVTTYGVTGLAPGSSYWFCVQAYNSGSWAYTQWQFATTRP